MQEDSARRSSAARQLPQLPQLTDAAAPDDSATVFDASAPADAAASSTPDDHNQHGDQGDQRAAATRLVDAGAASPGKQRSASAPTGATGASGSQDAGRSDVPSTHACAADLDPSHKPKSLNLGGALQLSDPTLIESREAPGSFYVFATGPGLSLRSSTDLLTWQDAGRVFVFDPAWIALTLESSAELWSPDVSFFGGLYHLYYAASKQGNNRSCIGHATAKTLPGPFEDQGSVLCSSLGAQRDDWNAIHPNYIEDETGRPYLAFGSFYSGIKLVALDASTGKVADGELISIAARTKQGGAIEAPFIVKRCDYFYLFVSFDRCCDGVKSTYKVYVGRSKQLTGPYLDRDGTKMLEGGGTPLVLGDDTWHGPGHNAILLSRDRWYEAHHAYYAGDPSPAYAEGQAYLRISQLAWDEDGWPASGGP